MITHRSSLLLKVLVLLAMLVLMSCQPVLLALTSSTSAENALAISGETPFGQFNGVKFVKFEGVMESKVIGSMYRAPFEIVVPARPFQGNGRLLVEPYHYVEGAGTRDKLLTAGFLFEQGFSYAAICWQPPLPDFAEGHPCADYTGDAGVELQIIADFVKAFDHGNAAPFNRDFTYRYAVGFSNSAEPLHRLLLDPRGQGLFDLSILMTTGWPLPIEPFATLPENSPTAVLPDDGVGKVLVLQSEADVVLFNGALLRDDGMHPYYRAYAVAGGQHIQGMPPTEAPGLQFMPVMRALFLAGDRWVVDGIEPPASAFLEEAPLDMPDPVYERPTGIARDENLNALGGIRLPDLALGRDQYIATNVDEVIWFGQTVDLACESRVDGSVRFDSHDEYVAKYVQESMRLVDEGFLLPEDAYQMIVSAAESTVGIADVCP